MNLNKLAQDFKEIFRFRLPPSDEKFWECNFFGGDRSQYYFGGLMEFFWDLGVTRELSNPVQQIWHLPEQG